MKLQFQYPEALWLLAALPLIVLLFLMYLLWRRRTLRKTGNVQLLKGLYASHSGPKVIFRFILFLFAFALGCVAVANPRQPDEMQEDERKGIDVLLALDVSNSMLATDLPPNRLQRAKAMLLKLMENLPDDRIGLVLFAGNAYIQMPLTTDHSAARMFIATAHPSVIGAQGTSLVNALEKCSLAFQNSNDRFKTIVLLSDGEAHDEDAVTAAGDLAAKGIMINTIGIGSPEGSTIITDTTAGEKKDINGAVVVSKLNEPLLRQVAAATNGTYIHLQTAEQAVTQLLAQLSGIEKKALGDTSLFTYKTFYAWLALPMLFLLIGELFFPDRKKIKI